jgi:hypothetical protein
MIRWSSLTASTSVAIVGPKRVLRSAALASVFSIVS